MNPAADNRPHLLIIAGPNGSGKSSAYEASVAEVDGRSFRTTNPDLFAKRIRDLSAVPEQAANLEAVKRIEQWLETSILAGHTVGDETVLSTTKYRRIVALAKGHGYRIQLNYVVLDSPQRNVERVAIRVRRGGHSVPKDKIIDRYRRSIDQLTWFLAQADDAWIWDNSGATIRQIGEKRRGVLTLDLRALPAIAEAVHAATQMQDSG